MPNYYDMSGEAASASAQQTTGAENGPTADTVGATTTGAGTEQDNDVQRLHRYKLPPPFFTGDYSQYEEWLFKLQAYLGLIDRDFDLVLQLTQVATRQIANWDQQGITLCTSPTKLGPAGDHPGLPPPNWDQQGITLGTSPTGRGHKSPHTRPYTSNKSSRPLTRATLHPHQHLSGSSSYSSKAKPLQRKRM